MNQKDLILIIDGHLKGAMFHEATICFITVHISKPPIGGVIMVQI